MKLPERKKDQDVIGIAVGISLLAHHLFYQGTKLLVRASASAFNLLIKAVSGL